METGWVPHIRVPTNSQVYCTSKFLSIGAGNGLYGLWVDDGLLKSVSYHCLTFGNEPLLQER